MGFAEKLEQEFLEIKMTEFREATRKWLYDTIGAMVDNETDVFIEVVTEDQAMTLKVQVAPEDVGKVIGASGRHAKALRALLSARGGKDGVRYVLDIVEADKAGAQ